MTNHCEERKGHAYHCKSKYNSPVLLKLLFYRIETINKCVWLQMARIEMNFSSLCSPVSDEKKKGKKMTWLVFLSKFI